MPIKLIACDIDGTLIPYGQVGLPPELFPLIRRLREQGVLFCPASGRQYRSLRLLFAPVAEEMAFVCENGNVVFGPGPEETAPVLSKSPIPRADALALAGEIQALPGCDALISGERVSYVWGCEDSFIRYMEEMEGNRMRRVERLEDIPEDVVKISAWCPDGPEEPMAALGPRWGKYHMAVAGPDWLDFGGGDKGVGLRGLCAGLGIALEEVAAFGDNWNDLPMLEAAGEPWLMCTADPELARRFPRQCESVVRVLEEKLKVKNEK